MIWHLCARDNAEHLFPQSPWKVPYSTCSKHGLRNILVASFWSLNIRFVFCFYSCITSPRHSVFHPFHTMSWLSSIFSNFTFSFPPPADSIRPQSQTHTPSIASAPVQLQPQPKRILDEPSSQFTPTPTTPSSTSPSTIDSAQIQAEGRRRNKIIFAAGLAFFGLSILTTRRSLARRRLASKAAFYKDAPSHHTEQTKQVSGAFEAVEALNIATINVLSLALMATGGALWYLDINSMAQARRLIRGGLGVDGTGKTEQEAEEEIEEFIATVLARKEAKEAKK